MDTNTGEVFCQFQQFLTSPPCPPNEACPPTKCEMNWVTGVLYDPFAEQNRQCFSWGGYVPGYPMPTGFQYINTTGLFGIANNAELQVSAITIRLLPGTLRKYVNGLVVGGSSLYEYVNTSTHGLILPFVHLLDYTDNAADLNAVVPET
eukprot:3935635-Rhodomonas_salina.1